MKDNTHRGFDAIDVTRELAFIIHRDAPELLANDSCVVCVSRPIAAQVVLLRFATYTCRMPSSVECAAILIVTTVEICSVAATVSDRGVCRVFRVKDPCVRFVKDKSAMCVPNLVDTSTTTSITSPPYSNSVGAKDQRSMTSRLCVLRA